MKRGFIWVFCLISLLIFLPQGYAKLKERDVVAVVNGEPITVKELLYAAGIEHRREDLPRRAKRPDLNRFLQEIIRDNLIIQEAKAMGLETNPWLEAKLKEFIITAAVRELHQEEVLSKIKPDESTLKNFYKEYFKTYKWVYFQSANKEEAEKARTKILTNSGNFTIFENIKISLLMNKDLWNIIKDLKPGETSKVHKIYNNYIVVKLVEIKPARMEEFKKRINSVKDAYKRFEKERLEKIKLEALRKKYQSKILVYRENIKKVQDKNQCNASQEIVPLARVERETLNSKQFCEALKENPHLKVEEYVDKWIDARVIDIEALSRGYHLRSPLKEDIENYKKQLLKRVFIGNIIAPTIKIKEDDLIAYYNKNKSKFREENSYKIGRIVVDDHHTALKVLAELDKGADFLFLAEKYAKDEEIRKTKGVMGWLTESLIPENYKKAFTKLEKGAIGMTQDGPHWTILKILDKKEGQIKPFNKVKKQIEEELWKNNLEQKLEEYAQRLRKNSKIVVYQNKIQEIERTLFK